MPPTARHTPTYPQRGGVDLQREVRPRCLQCRPATGTDGCQPTTLVVCAGAGRVRYSCQGAVRSMGSSSGMLLASYRYSSQTPLVSCNRLTAKVWCAPPSSHWLVDATADCRRTKPWSELVDGSRVRADAGTAHGQETPVTGRRVALNEAREHAYTRDARRKGCAAFGLGPAVFAPV